MPLTTLPFLYAITAILFIWEHVFPAHSEKTDWRWYTRALLINILQLGIFYLIDLFWSAQNKPLNIFSLQDTVSPLTGAVIGYFIFTFIIYWWHRARHNNKFIWRLFHQFHHSPKHIQTLTAYYIHPLDMITTLFISNFIMYILLGLNFEAASWYTLITGLAGFFIHANIRIPRQVGYLFQTPEMHRLHHKSNHHANNYSDIVLWDMLFGTYCNPKEPVKQCGFDEQREKQVLPMILGKDLYKSK